MQKVANAFLLLRALINALGCTALSRTVASMVKPTQSLPNAVGPLQRKKYSSKTPVSIALTYALFHFSSASFAQWQNLADFGDTAVVEEDAAQQESAVLSRPELKAKEFFRAVNDPQLKAELDAQYAAIQELLQSGNSFNHDLGERYYSYAQLLREAGRLDEAASALVDALHIQKANYGLFDHRHRPLLEALYTLNFERNKIDRAEEYLQTLLLMEGQIDQQADARVFEMVMQMGHHYLNVHLDARSGSDVALGSIDRALGYFRWVLREFPDDNLSERLLPYGEYAFASILKKREIEVRISEAGNSFDTNFNSGRMLERESRFTARHVDQSFENSLKILERFKDAAYEQNNQALIVSAWTALGDLCLLFYRTSAANELYAKAWQEALLLPESAPERSSLTKAAKLPHFVFSRPWERAIPEGSERLIVPVLVSVSRAGRVVDIEPAPNTDMAPAILARTKRTLRGLVFRPRFVNGEPDDTKDQPYEAELLVKSTWLNRVIEKMEKRRKG